MHQPSTASLSVLSRRDFEIRSGDPMAPWLGGSASLASSFIKKYLNEAKKFVAN